MKNNLKIKKVLCGFIAFSAGIMTIPSTFLFLYEPEVPTKLKK